MTISQEELLAYVDGECDAEAAGRIERAALQDPALASRIAEERRLRERLQAHFEPVASASLPAGWEAMIRAATDPAAQRPATVVDLAEARARRQADLSGPALPARRRMWIGTAIAASLVLGLFLGAQLRPGAPFVARDGVMTAKGELATALDTQLASQQAAGPVRVLLTFRGTGGELCRSFSGTDASGIACRAGDTWQLRHVLPGAPADSRQYRQAGSHDGELMALAQQMAQGDAFDAAQELAARKRGWR